MRAVVQRVLSASVTVDEGGREHRIARIGCGLLVLAAVGKNDGEADAAWLADRLLGLRIFPGPGGDMDIAVAEYPQTALLVVSQFTLFGDCRKGRRPSFCNAAAASQAAELYTHLVESLARSGIPVATGRFQAMMRVDLANWGPVTILLDSKKEF